MNFKSFLYVFQLNKKIFLKIKKKKNVTNNNLGKNLYINCKEEKELKIFTK